MAAIPYMPFYFADHLADTTHLTTLEQGAYFLLIANYWQTGKPLPDDDKYLAKVCRLSLGKFLRIKDTLKSFFSVQFLDSENHNLIENNQSMVENVSKHRGLKVPTLVHFRIEDELQKVRVKSVKARLSAENRWDKKQCERNANAMRTQCYTDIRYRYR